jgi:anaerobic dimethyl sulfoxide reductase subunit A
MAAGWMLGERVPGDDRATLLDARLIILWGMNPGELRLAPNTDHFIAQARDRGARVILIDPRYTDSGVLADQWIPIRPGTDAALAAALAYFMETEDLVDRAFLASHTVGYDLYRRYVLGLDDGTPKTPAWAEAITGVPVATIVQLARDYATVKPAALLPGWGPQRALYGEQYARAMITLACMTGNVGTRGGGVASVGTRGNIVPIGSLPMGPKASRRRISSAAWAAPILEGALEPPITLAYIVASNLINRSPNTLGNIRALEMLDFVVVHEQFLTPTTRHADIVLPIVTDLERSELVTSWGYDTHLFQSQQVLPPAGEARTDYWIFAQLAQRLGVEPSYSEGRTEQQWLDHLLSQAPIDRAPLERDGLLRLEGAPRVALADFRADPVAHPLKTASGRIEIASAQAVAVGLPLIPSYVPAETEPDVAPGALQLVTPHSKQRSNSCAHASPWIRDAAPHTLWLNPQDAQARGIADGDAVEAFNAQGTVRVAARVTERIMPGVACLYQGTWYAPDAKGVDEGGCANVLTDHRLSPSGGPTMHTTWIEVRKGAQ